MCKLTFWAGPHTFLWVCHQLLNILDHRGETTVPTTNHILKTSSSPSPPPSTPPSASSPPPPPPPHLQQVASQPSLPSVDQQEAALQSNQEVVWRFESLYFHLQRQRRSGTSHLDSADQPSHLILPASTWRSSGRWRRALCASEWTCDLWPTCGEDLLQVQDSVDQGVGVVGLTGAPVDCGQQRPRQDAAGTCRLTSDHQSPTDICTFIDAIIINNNM